MPRKTANPKPETTGGATATRAAKPKPVARGRGKGKNSNAMARACRLAEVPADVFFAIAKRLQPLDLLHLARTCKTFRGALMKRSARHVWTAAIQEAEGAALPAVPGDVSEPAWIDLLLSRVCHGCLKKGVFIPLWEIRMRLCPACKKGLRTAPHNATSIHSLSTLLPELDFEVETAQMGVYKLVPVVAKGLMEIYRLQLGGPGLPYLEVDFEELKCALSAAASVEERTTIVQERKTAMATRRKHVDDCERWVLDTRIARSENKENPQVSRRKAIVAKLRELGWGPHLDRMSFQERDGFLKMREVSQGGPLTDRVWASIKDECIDYMEFVQMMHKGGDQGDGIIGWDGADSLDDEDDWMIEGLKDCGPSFKFY